MELLIELGWIQRLGFVTAPFMRFGHLREEVDVSFLVSFGSPTAGNSMVAELNKKGLIDNKETLIASREIVITLLVGRVLSSIVRLRFTIPYYTGIFSPKVGTQIMLLATMMQKGLTIIVIAILAVFW